MLRIAAQLLTGCYAPRVGVPGVFFPLAETGSTPEHTVAEYLRELGYATMCVANGIWAINPSSCPRHGFDGYFGIPYSNDMGRTAVATGKRVHPLLRDDKVAVLLEDEGQRRITREYTEEAVKFIEASAKADKNFFLYLPIPPCMCRCIRIRILPVNPRTACTAIGWRKSIGASDR